MKKISYWAKHHVWQSRLLIILIYILLNIIGIRVGQLLKEINIIIPQAYFIACTIFTITIWIIYPKKKTKRTISASVLYMRKKLFYFCLGVVTFLMIIYAGNNWEYFFMKTEAVQASKIIRPSKDSAVYNNLLVKRFIANINGIDVSKLSQREKIRLIKKQIKTIKNDTETSKGEKALLITLSIIIALALLFGLAGLSCSIGCAGSEGLAIIVALAGTFLIIFFLAVIIKRISNLGRRKENPKVTNLSLSQ